MTTGYVNTTANESTSSSSYTDLSTVTSVTVTTGTKALVLFGAKTNPPSGQLASCSIAVSGATTISANDDNRISTENGDASIFRAIQFTLTAGSNTFTMKHKVSGGTGFYNNRVISVIDLGS